MHFLALDRHASPVLALLVARGDTVRMHGGPVRAARRPARAVHARDRLLRLTSKSCPFCSLPGSRIVDSTETGWVIRDAYPVSPGHTLVIPKRHVGSLFELTAEDRGELFALVTTAKTQIDAEHRPSAYNIGINDGPAAGQTVPHLHIHLIPRYDGARDDPRGGIRWIIPEKADYWSRR